MLGSTQHAVKRWLKCGSPLRGSGVKYLCPVQWRSHSWWQGACPCCRRPLEIELCDKPASDTPEPSVKGRYAYVITLWGTSKAYVLGALVLGFSIKATGTKHSLVCLHASDVPAGFVALLGKIWECREIEHVDASKELSWPGQAGRFEKVFTKLRCLSLVDFEKILMMDIDMMVLANVDDLFDLAAPAGMRRGMRHGQKHGDVIDGRGFFTGAGAGTYSWGQGTGINAGVMLLRPSSAVLDEMLTEIAEPSHPAHIRGNGPEQDFLSRYWADAPWTHIGVEYNYQLHHMYNAMHPTTVHEGGRMDTLQFPERIKIVHFSGEPGAKPWQRVLKPELAHTWPDRSHDAAYIELFQEEFLGYWLWIKRDRSAWDKATTNNKWEGAYTLGEDGEIYQTGGFTEEDTRTLIKIPESVATGSVRVLERCLGKWFDAFEDMQRTLFEGADVVASLSAAVAPSGDQHCLSNAGVDATDIIDVVEDVSWKGTWFATERQVGTLRASAPAPKPTVGSKGFKFKTEGGWAYEEIIGCQGAAVLEGKATVSCSNCPGARYVIFHGPGFCEPFFPDRDEGFQGLFVKTLGRSARCLEICGADVSPVHLWADGIEVGQVVLIAMLGLDTETIAAALAALAQLGVPQGPVCDGLGALATAGVAAGDDGRIGSWNSHASVDIAYASVLAT
eukprot:TRINITY_DN43575_c0_g1_i1.p1 TRINITY_DN43575_c0_g1~~TRINITY_DN43575_c0_g1_i1.p1  ORF type:complete len:674 (+),score=73.58 TRINITY_DN43575_c0_g1_i1:227-2248(+)